MLMDGRYSIVNRQTIIIGLNVTHINIQSIDNEKPEH